MLQNALMDGPSTRTTCLLHRVSHCTQSQASSCFQLRRSLASAAASTLPVIRLHHFLPLQISLLGIYARLSAITVHLLDSLRPQDRSNMTTGDTAAEVEAGMEATEDSIVIPRDAPLARLSAVPSTSRSGVKVRKKKDAMDDIFGST